RAGSAEWLAEERVLSLARDFGSLLPYDVRVGEEAVTGLPAPWDRAYPSPAARRVALARHCHDLFGFTPLDSIDLDVPL
ncbi:HSP90 family protein, partial [Streptomyces sp. CHB19.2]|nr:HSP90 family protein [Streptomyces sp. CHB19.2]